MRLDLHRTKRQELGDPLLLRDLWQVNSSLGVYSQLLPQGGIRHSPESPYSKKNAIINYLQALGQHFHNLPITHSVSIRGRQRHRGFTWRRLGWCPSRQPLDLSIQPKRSGGLGKVGWVQLSPRRHPWAGTCHKPLRYRCKQPVLPHPSLCKDSDLGQHLSLHLQKVVSKVIMSHWHNNNELRMECHRQQWGKPGGKSSPRPLWAAGNGPLHTSSADPSGWEGQKGSRPGAGLLGISKPEPVHQEGSIWQNFSGVCSE